MSAIADEIGIVRIYWLMTSNIEPIAREMTGRICRRNGMSETKIPAWVDLHWPCSAAMLEAGVMDEDGEWIIDQDVHLGIEGISRAPSTPKVRADIADSDR